MNIFSWFRKENKKDYRDFEIELQKSIAKTNAKFKQEQEDFRIEMAIFEEVNKVCKNQAIAKMEHEMWKSQNPEGFKDIPFLWLRDWNRHMYIVYDEETAKFSGNKLDEYRNKIFKELSEKWEISEKID